MGSEVSACPLHVVFLPYLAPGHTIPMLDMVRLMANRGVKTTVITTPFNAPNVAKHLEIGQPNDHKTDNTASNTATRGVVPNVHIIPFPPTEKTGLAEGVQNQGLINSRLGCLKFMMAMELLKDPVEQFMEENKCDCLVTDLFFPFASDLAKKFGIPRLAFNVTGYFPMCVMMALKQYQPDAAVASEYDTFLVPGLPHEINMSKSQLQDSDADSEWEKFMNAAVRGFMTSFGHVYNTFYELEPDYADYYRKSLCKRVWNIGPVSLCDRGIEDQFKRGESATICEHECLKWLDSKPPNSVIYLSFGTLTHFKGSQLKEIAIALENLGRDFIWVVRERKGEDHTVERQIEDGNWLPEGYEDRIKGRGLIIRGWAPQVLILEHGAVGAFVTHCGWNSALEGFTAGVPMVTWPIHAEHFYIEKLITDVVKVGVEVGNKKWSSTADGTFITHDKIEVALKQIMDGEEAVEMRSRAMTLKEHAHKAVKEGGSSYTQLDSLIQELVSFSPV